MTSADVRTRLTHALRLDVIGPEPGEPQESELLRLPPSRWYLTGFLVPWNAPSTQKSDEDEQGELEMAAAGAGAEDDDTAAEPPAAKRGQFPSSMGISLLVPPGACAMTEEHSLPTLEASHIKPFALDGPHNLNNGILLRSDLHRLFDTGYITVTPDYRIRVSDVLREHFQNGRSYYPYQDRPLAVIPPRPEDRPSPELLRWHNDVCFRRRPE